MAEREFWALTPRELRALADRRRLLHERDDYRTGVLASAIWNVNGGRDGKAVKPSDFFGFSEKPSANGHTPPRKVEQTEQAVVDGWLAWAEMCRSAQQQRLGKH